MHLFAYNSWQIFITTPQKTKFSIKDFFGRCKQVRIFLRIFLHFLKISLTRNFIFLAVYITKSISKNIRNFQ